MFNKIFIDIVRRRHYWRNATFSEISELYISRVLRIVGASLGVGFVFIFLLQLGYSLSGVMVALIMYLVYRMLLAPFVAMLIARYGPKHAIFISNILYVPGMISLGLAPSLGIGAIIIWGLFVGISVTIYQMAYYVDFSKVKSVENSGKELGLMNIFEKIAAAISPVLGGFIALVFGPSALMWTSAVVIMIAAIPLMTTSEPTKTRQKINWKDFNFRLALPSYRAQSAIGFDMTSTASIWSFFLAFTIFSSASNAIYLNLGILSSLSFIASIVVSYFFGKMIDGHSGRQLLQFSVLINSAVYLARPFTNNAVGAASVNAVNEIGYTGYSMANMRGLFDVADTSGHRIMYLLGAEVATLIGSITAASIFLILITYLPTITAFNVFFVFAAVVVLLIGSSKFAIYSK